MAYERIVAEHAQDLERLMLDLRVGRTLWTSTGRPTAAELEESLQRKIEHWERYGFGLWLVRDSTTGEMVGRGGLQHTTADGADVVEAGWAIVPERWGMGHATELAQVAVENAFGPLALESLVAFTLPDNLASRRVMEKSGFAYSRDITHAGMAHVLYERGPDGAA